MSTALNWFKSSYSGSEGGQCLEVAYDWRKSSYSGSEGGACVEVATHPTAVHIRDSKNPDGPHFTVTPEAWGAFVPVATADTDRRRAR
ncbi:DUF397 domain-containing protein [Streptomyces endophyticus]|uniref:DUF397 domain-containing protein n=1 Tax=Streptomyces endophyticus TaxID=714166 RepID=A0ABU6FGA7_9ACTN|nr:DUF397 domain-containing protein [Streptomyces endophyticus]MEB8343074.1 DUF397 domain-containing protein [Streptomyces endophyticus]